MSDPDPARPDINIECFMKNDKQICSYRDGGVQVDLPGLARVDPNHVDVAIGPTNDPRYPALPYASLTCSRDIHGPGKDDNDYQCTLVSHISDHDFIARRTDGCDVSCPGHRSENEEGATVMSIQCAAEGSKPVTLVVHDVSPFYAQITRDGEPFDPFDPNN